MVHIYNMEKRQSVNASFIFAEGIAKLPKSDPSKRRATTIN
jgi:hypothetical protein